VTQLFEIEKNKKFLNPADFLAGLKSWLLFESFNGSEDGGL
jgi:hypothetical protein